MCKVMLGQVVDALLAEDHICAAGDHLICCLLYPLLLMLHEHLELIGGGDLDLSLGLSVLGLDGAGEQGHLGICDLAGHILVDDLLVDHHSLDDL